MDPTTDGVAIQEGLAGLFNGVVDLIFNLFLLVFTNFLNQVFTEFFAGLPPLF
jgi:hypothetical protein